MSDAISKEWQQTIAAHKKGYTVDDFGNVISPLKKKLKLQKRKVNTCFYYKFSVKLEDRRCVISVHKLQAYQKYKDDATVKGLVVRHKNGNSLDNSKLNILIGTYQDNSLDRPKKDRINQSVHATQFCRVWNDDLLKQIFDDRYLNKFTYKDLKEKYCIAGSSLSFIFNKSLFSKNYNYLGIA